MNSKWFKLLFVGIFGARAMCCCAQVFPALAVEQVVVVDAAAYAALVDEINAAMKREHQVPLFLRAYESISTTGGGDRAFSLSPAGTFESLLENQSRFESEEAFAGFRERMGDLCEASGRTYLKAVRFDGTNSPGWLLNTLVKTEDEMALLTRLETVPALLGLEEGKEPQVNVFRVVAGQATFTHLVSLNFESRATLGAGLDAIAEHSWSLAYSAKGAAICEIVESVVYRELVP